MSLFVFPVHHESLAFVVFHPLSNGDFKMTNTNARDAKRIIHELDYALQLIYPDALPPIAKGLAKNFNIPQKVMLKTMKSYARIHHTNQGL